MPESNNTVEIAVIKSEIKGMREQQKSHAVETRAAITDLSSDVKNLVAVMNKGKGAFGFAMVLAGGLGAAAVKLLDLFGG